MVTFILGAAVFRESAYVYIGPITLASLNLSFLICQMGMSLSWFQEQRLIYLIKYFLKLLFIFN